MSASRVLSKLSRRAAVFTVSPITVYSWRCSPPKLPATRGPVKIPTRIRILGIPCFSHCIRRRANSVRMESAQSTALVALRAIASSLSSAMGTPKTAIMASPINLLTWPPWASTTLTIALMYSLSQSISSWGSIDSETVVKFCKSVNNTVAVRRWETNLPSLRYWSRAAQMTLATSLETWRLKRFIRVARSWCSL